MKKRKTKAAFGAFLIFVFFAACNFHNPIMDKWWEEPELQIVFETFFTVTFDADGGTPAPGDQKIAQGNKVGKVPAMTKSGYGFGGWYRDAARTQEWDFATDIVNADITLYAKWSSPYYTVTFNANGGRPEPELQHIAAGTKIVEPTAIRKAADTDVSPTTWLGFGGWWTDDGRLWNFATDTVSSNMILTALWTEPPQLAHVYVAFDADGGIPEPRPQDLMKSAKIVEPYAMNKDGFGFGGWYTEPGFERQWNFAVDTVSDSDTTNYLILYAKWVTNYYTVSFNADGGAPAPRDQIVSYGTKIAKPPVMRRGGKGFGGWYTDPGFSSEWDFDASVQSDMTLYARWGDEFFTVVFNSHDEGLLPLPSSQHGSLVPDNQIIAAGGKIAEPPDVNRLNYCFAGWYTKQTGGDPWDFDSVVTDDNLSILGADVDVSGTTVTLYAYWVPEDPDMAWVKRGSFIMGDNSVSGAKPAHKVTINSGFYIDRYLVTVDKYNAVMSPGGSPVHNNHFSASGGTAPMDSALWDVDAIEYCKTLSGDPTLIPDNVVAAPLQAVYSGSGASVIANWNANGYRLPTEAEWEYAARGGNGSPGNFIYAGSNNPDDVGWYNTNSGSMTRPVGTKLSNSLGIYDMSGNICEWCWDWFDSGYYSSSPVIDPRGPASGTERVRRGGSWNNAYGNIRTTIRMSFKPTGPRQDFWTLGFRVARGPVNPPSYTGL